MLLSAGTKIGPYDILSAIGAGGMGEVYRARDARLGRDVAIKVLPEAFAANPDRLRRFEHEAQAIAALNHPHICQIHDIGPGYLVLEFVEGEPLRGPLPADHAVRLALQIASALGSAHQRDILHRDLKPANIMVTREGTAKLLDFGLAKLMGSPSDGPENVTRTGAGTVLGTAAYMSPEQAEGKPLDARSDVFSFGAVLYEMLSGVRAFAGDTSAQVMSAVLRDDPPSLDVSPALERLVRRCLAKQPLHRFQTMQELTAALEEVSTRPGERQPSIAVLAFENMSGDKENEYFSDGLAEEIINALTRIPGLKVIARTSAFAFKGKHEDVRRIAQALGVTNVLEGSVRKAGSRIRVTAQLITAADGSHVWSEQYDRELADVFAIQDEISQAIASALQVKLSAVTAPLPRHSPDIAAYEAYLKGRYHLAQRTRTKESLARCKECLEQAIALDPQFALPHSELGRYYENMAVAGLHPARESLSLARAEAQRALDLDPSLPQGHSVLGVVAGLLDYDWKEAERWFRMAMAHTPVPPEVRAEYGAFYLLPQGRLKEAATEGERALKEDPLSMLIRTQLAVSLAPEERASENYYRQMLELDENFIPALFGLGMNFASRGMLAEALALAEKANSLAPWNFQVIGLLAGVLALMGEASRAEDWISRFRPGLAYGAPRGLAIFYLLCSEIDEAADWFEKAIEQRDPMLIILMRHPVAEPLRTSPRWPALARLMNLPETS